MTGIFLFILILAHAFRITHGNDCNVVYKKQYEGMVADCSERTFSDIPGDLPTDIVLLDLSSNLLSLLPKYAFARFENLIHLNLNNNTIHTMDNKTFKGLYKLRSLHIARNQLSDNKISFPIDVFRDLRNLQILNVEKNEITSYPDWVFPPLTNLHNLYIDSLPSPHFGPGFRSLTNLKRLQMDSKYLTGGKCRAKRLTNSTFYNLRTTHLEVLVINNCPLVSCEYGVFEPLVSLTRLEFSQNQVGVHAALSLLHPFRGKNMSAILLNNVKSDNPLHLPDRSLTAKSAQYLKRICVSEFSMNQNSINWMETDSLFESEFSDCVESLDLSNNRIVGNVRILFMFSLFPKLTRLKLGYQFQLQLNKVVKNSSFTDSVDFPKFEVTLPSNLTYFDLSGIIGPDSRYLFELVFFSTIKLRTFNFGYNKMNYLFKLRGLENVTTVDMSGNNFLDFKGVLSSFPSVNNLILTHCSLRLGKPSGNSDNILQPLPNLVNVNFSNNDIRSFPNFPYPSKIVELDLSHNELDYISLTLHMYTKLTTLDLSYNLIGQIDTKVRSSLDEVHVNNGLLIILSGNPFLCGCNNLDFILWLVHSPVIYETDRNFPCMQENGTTTGAENIAWNYISTSRRCNGKYILSVTVTFLTVLVTSLITSYFVSKNISRFRKALLKMFGARVNLLAPRDFAYMLYVGYCSEDIPFVFRTLRKALERMKISLFLKDRNVLPGVDIADGIVEGINNSWKTLLVVSRDFLSDPWSKFIINSAVYAMTDSIPERIIVILMDDVQVEELPETLLNVIDEDHILCVDDFDEGIVWEKVMNIGKFQRF